MSSKKAIDWGVRFSGATVHFVAEDVDMGPIILQAVVPVLQDDTEDTLAARILVEEHKIYPESVKLYFEGRLEVRGSRVVHQGSMNKAVEEQLAYLRKGCVDVIQEDELRNKIARSLRDQKPLKVKVGFDPTAPDIHLGHTVRHPQDEALPGPRPRRRLPDRRLHRAHRRPVGAVGRRGRP